MLCCPLPHLQAATTDESKGLLRQFRPTKSQKVALTLAAAASAAPERRKEKENMAEFIAKKREIFLLQVCADHCSHCIHM